MSTASLAPPLPPSRHHPSRVFAEVLTAARALDPAGNRSTLSRREVLVRARTP